jgi:hypothetical protein
MYHFDKNFGSFLGILVVPYFSIGLGGKPNLKKRGMVGICYGWAIELGLGLGPFCWDRSLQKEESKS